MMSIITKSAAVTLLDSRKNTNVVPSKNSVNPISVVNEYSGTIN